MSFHVPEKFRLKVGRMRSTPENGNNGAFLLPSVIPSRTIFAIASDGSDWHVAMLPGEPWEHVSVHCEEGKRSRTPTWREMNAVKAVVWDDEDVVMQLHPRASEYVNNHPDTLHLWRPTVSTIPTPPAITVGIKEFGEIKSFDDAKRLALNATANRE
jgi:hypothetical protein